MMKKKKFASIATNTIANAKRTCELMMPMTDGKMSDMNKQEERNVFLMNELRHIDRIEEEMRQAIAEIKRKLRKIEEKRDAILNMMDDQ
jgi:phosphomevalonate kinase